MDTDEKSSEATRLLSACLASVMVTRWAADAINRRANASADITRSERIASFVKKGKNLEIKNLLFLTTYIGFWSEIKARKYYIFELFKI